VAIRSANFFERKLYCTLKLGISELTRAAMARAMEARRMTMAFVIGFVTLFA
jgi:hypothetical protein